MFSSDSTMHVGSTAHTQLCRWRRKSCATGDTIQPLLTDWELFPKHLFPSQRHYIEETPFVIQVIHWLMHELLNTKAEFPGSHKKFKKISLTEKDAISKAYCTERLMRQESRFAKLVFVEAQCCRRENLGHLLQLLCKPPAQLTSHKFTMWIDNLQNLVMFAYFMVITGFCVQVQHIRNKCDINFVQCHLRHLGAQKLRTKRTEHLSAPFSLTFSCKVFIENTQHELHSLNKDLKKNLENV